MNRLVDHAVPCYELLQEQGYSKELKGWNSSKQIEHGV